MAKEKLTHYVNPFYIDDASKLIIDEMMDDNHSHFYQEVRKLVIQGAREWKKKKDRLLKTKMPTKINP